MGDKKQEYCCVLASAANWDVHTRKLLAIMQEQLSEMPPLEMRETEIVLYKVDKTLEAGATLLSRIGYVQSGTAVERVTRYRHGSWVAS